MGLVRVRRLQTLGDGRWPTPGSPDRHLPRTGSRRNRNAGQDRPVVGRLTSFRSRRTENATSVDCGRSVRTVRSADGRRSSSDGDNSYMVRRSFPNEPVYRSRRAAGTGTWDRTPSMCTETDFYGISYVSFMPPCHASECVPRRSDGRRQSRRSRARAHGRRGRRSDAAALGGEHGRRDGAGREAVRPEPATHAW